MLKKNGKTTKKWVLRDSVTEQALPLVHAISDTLGIGTVVSRLLYNRGYTTPEAAASFLRLETEILCDPFLLDDADKAIDRVRLAIERGERITVYGDYDVDGVTAVCTLLLYLRSHGANADYYIPNRSGEGYGVSCSAIDALHSAGTSLIVTVDTGVTAIEEITYAKTLGIDFVVTDHHECLPTLPPAVAVLNPHRPDSRYPFRELAGVGVVFKFISAYEETVSGDSRAVCARRICERYADLIAIGTIADVMPIREENRLIVKEGLRLLDASPRIGFSALCESVRSAGRSEGKRPAKQAKVTSGFIGYTIAPRLNAAGRIRSASLAVELFLTEDPARAEALAEELCEANRERQAEENKIMAEAYEKIEREHDFGKDPVIVLAADGWHHGVIGIVASRITDRYGLPCILVSFDNDDAHADTDVGKGSGRSVKGLNLVDALVYASDTLVKFGGHELAAGLSVTRGNLPLFRERINEYARKTLRDEDRIPTMEADCELSLSDLSMELCEELGILEPYGVENPVPTFVLRSLKVLECSSISAGKHTRLLLGDEHTAFTAMCFSMPLSDLDLFVGDHVDVMFNPDINEWCGRKSVQLIVRDIRLSEGEARHFEKARRRYEEIRTGGAFTEDENVLPSREDFAAVYTLVRRSVRAGGEVLTHRGILSQLSGTADGIGYVKLKFIIRILQELNLLGIEEISEEVYRFRLQYSQNKTDLEKSNLLRRLRSQMKQA
ncbi:MAG: single-stranded-DNA-specific exonuclease RecJ [Clostridia bacterium]|nr:single-stranded-DNA-specific exonuclease RecJ [Clostridia bacterium]